MKHSLLYLFLIIYSASILKPAMPYFSDAIAHTFYYAEHVKTVHFENGKYHVHHELVRQAQNNTGNESNDFFKKNSLPDEHILFSDNFESFDLSLHNVYSLFSSLAKLPACKNAVFSPPRYLFS